MNLNDKYLREYYEYFDTFEVSHLSAPRHFFSG